MQRVAIQEPKQDIVRVSETPQNLGFELQLLSSQKYVLRKLENLKTNELGMVRHCLIRCGHPRFRKEFAGSRHVPYGDSADFKEALEKADLAKLARLVRIVGMLLQTKFYLFWRNPLSESQSSRWT